MREIPTTKIIQTVAELCIKANIHADPGICSAIKQARCKETSTLAKSAMGVILENMDVAKAENMPICQDTGMVVVFVDMGEDVRVVASCGPAQEVKPKSLINLAINEGVRRGYRDGYLRASVVHDPISRKNTGDNTPAVIHYNIVSGDNIKITVMPKGFGSENKGGIKMLTPSSGLAGVEDFVVDVVRQAGPDPCPPIVVGVGVGGTMEKAALLSKEALAQMFEKNTDPVWAGVESRLLEKINALGIGAAGFKGNTTALGVRVLTYATHIAGLPVAVNIGCHVSRHMSAVI
ncbi:MAG: fumarate hydratase [Defluviitaleaceae bacterium]|nr:fumarate hydratase [Defluviitaleaceae bacterium]